MALVEQNKTMCGHRSSIVMYKGTKGVGLRCIHPHIHVHLHTYIHNSSYVYTYMRIWVRKQAQQASKYSNSNMPSSRWEWSRSATKTRKCVWIIDVVSFWVVSWYIVLCYVSPDPITSCHLISFHIESCQVSPGHQMWLAMSILVHFMSNHIGVTLPGPQRV